MEKRLLDKEFRVLNKGFVRLVDYMGGDERVVQSARVSYGDGTKTSRKDEMLIDYLLRNEHTSPFEQVVFTFHVKLPIFVARQWIRHRTARVNEISGRYSIMTPEFYVPDEDDISFQSSDNKQGRDNTDLPPELRERVTEVIKKGQKGAYSDYESMLDDNIARELARINLPLSLYTEWYWQIDLHNLFHFLKLRMDKHAQKEIRLYACKIYEICKELCPWSFKAFDRHILNAVRLSGPEKSAVKSLLKGEAHGLDERGVRVLSEKLGLEQDQLNTDSS